MKRSHVISAVVIVGLLTAVSYEAIPIWSDHQNGSSLITQEIQAACNYLVSNYNSTIGLVAETPAHQKYWLYSDNFLVSIVLSGCPPSPLGRTIVSNASAAVSRHPYPNQYEVLTAKFFFNASTNYQIYGSAWATINNGTGTLSPKDYADIAFLQAYFFEKWTVNKTQAATLFDQAVTMYDGIGFNDTAFHGQYQTYKLALYLYVARILNRPFQLSALVTLASMQDPNGGFHTGYLSDLSTNGTSTNTETTCLAILALHSLAA